MKYAIPVVAVLASVLAAVTLGAAAWGTRSSRAEAEIDQRADSTTRVALATRRSNARGIAAQLAHRPPSTVTRASAKAVDSGATQPGERVRDERTMGDGNERPQRQLIESRSPPWVRTNEDDTFDSIERHCRVHLDRLSGRCNHDVCDGLPGFIARIEPSATSV